MEGHRPAKDEAILTSVAESIGATLGTIAAKAESMQKALSDKVSTAKTRARQSAKAITKKKRANAGSRRVRRTKSSSRRARGSKKNS